MLWQGKLYVTEIDIAFSTRIFGVLQQMQIPYSDIAQISKRSIAGVIPNAIGILSLSGEDYLFASFLNRDAAYDLLEMQLNNFKASRAAHQRAIMHIEGEESAKRYSASHRKDKQGILIRRTIRAEKCEDGNARHEFATAFGSELSNCDKIAVNDRQSIHTEPSNTTIASDSNRGINLISLRSLLLLVPLVILSYYIGARSTTRRDSVLHTVLQQKQWHLEQMQKKLANFNDKVNHHSLLFSQSRTFSTPPAFTNTASNSEAI